MGERVAQKEGEIKTKNKSCNINKKMCSFWFSGSEPKVSAIMVELVATETTMAAEATMALVAMETTMAAEATMALVATIALVATMAVSEIA